MRLRRRRVAVAGRRLRAAALGRAFEGWWTVLGESRADRRALGLLGQRVRYRLTSDAFFAWVEMAFFGKGVTERTLRYVSSLMYITIAVGIDREFWHMSTF